MRTKGIDMSQEEQNIEVIKKGYAAFAAGDIETVMSLIDDNIEWVHPGESAISGTYHGKGELAQYFARLAEQSATTTPRRFRAEGHVVVALTDMTLGDERGQDADVFTLRDGKTVRAYVRAVSALMEGVFGRKPVAVRLSTH
jgi:ketosteroid isomerase-like protein